MNRLIAFSADDSHAATLAAWRDDSPGPACVLIYEQFVCTTKPQRQSRILSYSLDLLRRELDRLSAARLLRDGDILVRNVEDGHPADGTEYAEVHGRYARDLRIQADHRGCKTAAYGLFKMRPNGVAMHHTGAVPLLVSDLAARSVIGPDDYTVAELYCTSVSAPDGAERQQHRISEKAQRRWMEQQVSDVSKHGHPKPVIALCHPFYVRPGSPIHGRELHSRDFEICLGAARTAGTLALWAHVGPNSGGRSAEVVSVAAARFAIPGFVADRNR